MKNIFSSRFLSQAHFTISRGVIIALCQESDNSMLLKTHLKYISQNICYTPPLKYSACLWSHGSVVFIAQQAI